MPRCESRLKLPVEGVKKTIMLRVENLRKTFAMAEGEVAAVRGVSFEVGEGTFLTLLGPSGCGKTTTLRCVAGLEQPESGRITIGNEVAYSDREGLLVPAYKRGVGMVFQSYAIWPHMTVFDNVAFPLVHGGFKVPRAQVREKVRKALSLVGLEELERRPAPLLSGGQQQRVSLARALVYEPRLLLLDEPLSNLDAKLREEMRLELRELISRLRISTLYVTHDQEEALVLSDRIAVMSEGRILQEGAPRDIYLNPRHPFVASFIGNANFIDGTVRGNRDERGGLIVDTVLGQIVSSVSPDVGAGQAVSVIFRPEDVLIQTGRPTRAANTFSGTVRRMIFVGNRIQCQLGSGNLVINSDVSSRVEIHQGLEVTFEIPPQSVRVLKAK